MKTNLFLVLFVLFLIGCFSLPAFDAPTVQFMWATDGGETAKIAHPLIVRVAPDGKIWVGDSQSRFLIFDQDGHLMETWGRQGTGPGEFNLVFPGTYELSGLCGLAFSPDGSFYVADTFNSRIQHFDRDRRFLGEWGSYGIKNTQFMWPAMITLAGNGELIVSDLSNNQVKRFDANRKFLSKFNGADTPGGILLNPCGLAVDDGGRIYVAELAWYSDTPQGPAGRVRIFDKDGKELGVLGASIGPLSRPTDVVLDGRDNVYVSENWGCRVLLFNHEGQHILSWGSYGGGEGQFHGARAVATGKEGTVYVVEDSGEEGTASGARLQKFRISGL